MRRSTSTDKYIEVKAVADYTLIKAVGSKEKTANYIMALLNIVSFDTKEIL